MKKILAVVALTLSVSALGPLTETAQAQGRAPGRVLRNLVHPRHCTTVVTKRRIGLRVVRSVRKVCR